MGDITIDCQEWDRHLNHAGYGVLWHNGTMRRANRVVWAQAHGPIPRGLHVLHR